MEAIERDLDAHALRKKRRRCQDQVLRLLPGGRERTPPPVVYLLAVASGTLDDCFGQRGYAALVASSDLHRALACFGMRKVPGRSTCHELIRALTEDTLVSIIQAQLMIAEQEGLDDFKCVIGDSTATEADSAKPNNARLFTHLAHRTYDAEQKLCGLMRKQRGPKRVTRYLGQIDRLKYLLLATPNSAADRVARYDQLLEVGAKLLIYFQRGFPMLCKAEGSMLEPLLDRLRQDYDALHEMWFQIYQELYPDEDIGDPVTLRYSVADPDAAFIKKGHRPTVFGYRPHLACSDSGLVVAMDLTSGNPSDAKRMLPLLDVVSKWTGTIPEAVSFDSGYCSKANLKGAKARGIQTISFAGGKGRILLGIDWESDTMEHLRRRRNAIEALIGHFKQCYGLRRFYERSLKSARHQLLRSIMAYNFERMAVLLLQRLPKVESDAA